MPPLSLFTQRIASDPTLRRFGALLALTQVVAVAWFFHVDVPTKLAPGAEEICWPFFDACAHFLPPLFSVASLLLLATLASLAALLFQKPRTTHAGVVLLLLLEAARWAIVLQDYKLRLNQHYMALWVTVVFVFGDKRTLQWLIVAFYVAAGALKLNPEWLSGQALYGVPRFPGLPLLCAFVALLELVLVFGLFTRFRRIVLGVLVLFHLASWPIVSFFYPLLCLAFLTIFDGEPTPPARGFAFVACFALLQLVPRRDSAITGEWRWLALHMFDAHVTCHGHADVHGRGHVDLSGHLPVRIACDPLIYFHRAKALCRTGVELDLHLQTRQRTLIDEKNFCVKGLRYEIFRSNSWIR